jgi:Rrf2 family protein
VRLSKTSEYGLRALIRISVCWPHGQMRMHDLAEVEQLPASFLSNIMTRLRQHRFLHSTIGSKGGYRLARSPDRIRVSKVIACLESGPTFDQTKPSGRGPPGKVLVQRLGQILTRQINATLKGLTLADLIQQVADIQRDGDALMYHI